ncbi:MAG: flagellar brake protein [Sulfurimicrobium sp.]
MGDLFEELKLHVGDRLQIEVPSRQHDLKYFTTLVGYVKWLSILVRTPLVDSLPLPMRDGEKLIVRGFSGKETFSFDSTIERVCREPFYYLHLSYPDSVSTTTIRHAERVRVNLPVRVTPAGASGAIHATISNISTEGILIDTGEELGKKDEEISVSFHFAIQPNDYDAHIETTALIQNVMLQDNPSGDFTFQYGVKLLKLHSSQAILLQNLIYQKLLENHHNLA